MKSNNLTESKKLYQKVSTKYGVRAVLTKGTEELAELISAIAKLLNSPIEDDNVCEEIADVEIMIEQLRLIFDSDKIDEYKKYKLERLEKMVNEVI